MQEKTKSHSSSIDLLRGIAAFGIVACHLNLIPLTDGALIARWYSDMFVGLFAALSGYLMVTSSRLSIDGAFHAWLRYVMKRAIRILPTYIVWTIVYIIFGFIFDFFVRHGINPKWSSDGYMVRVIFRGNSASHLWFLICLFYGQVIFGFAIFFLPRLRGWFWIAVGASVLIISAYAMHGWFAAYPLRLFAFLVTGYGLGKVSRIADASSSGISLWSVILLFMLVVHFIAHASVPAFLRDWLVVVPLLVLTLKVSLPSRFVCIAGMLGTTSMGVFLVHPIIAAGFGLPIRKFFPVPYGVIPELIDWISVWGVSFALSCILIRVPTVRKFIR